MAIPRITKEDLKSRLESGTGPVLVDVRLKYPYEHSTVRLPGAVRLAPDAPDFGSLPTAGDVVVYDSDPDELVSARICAALIRRGRRASALRGGIGEWVAASYPTETKDAPKPAALAPGSLKG
jgi:rhodanese-related sulfurtransferase